MGVDLEKPVPAEGYQGHARSQGHARALFPGVPLARVAGTVDGALERLESDEILSRGAAQAARSAA